LLLAGMAKSQEIINHPIDLEKSYEDWTEVYTQEGIKFEVKEYTCSFYPKGNKALYLGIKVTNENKEKKLVRLEPEIFMSGNCINCNDRNEKLATLTLNPKESVYPTCDDRKKLGIFNKFTLRENPSTLSKLMLRTVEVYKL